MASVYLETSFVSACVTDLTDAASIYRRQISTEWWETQAARHSLYVSPEVVAELSHHAFPRRREALAMIRDVQSLSIDEDVRGLAHLLIREKVMPAPLAGDALHVAIATVHGMEYMLTWNVRHLANIRILAHLRIICRRAGFLPPSIVTPDLLWEDDA
jgi:predicted nucleic acid-binding protein